ncbi:MAG TPA: response regulator [Acidimicrobiales bacterium]|nr:response regulator [Acidimicrobiales bacterium]
MLVDARPDRRSVMRQTFEHSDVMATVVAEADDRADAMRAVEHRAADLVIVDLWAPVQDGLDFVVALRARFPAC